MGQNTAALRRLWKKYECDESQMVLVPFGPDRIRVAPPTAPVWEALAAVFKHHGYEIRTKDTDSYNCRDIKGKNQKSLHSYGIALDVNWDTNPYIDHAGNRKVRFSNKATQAERAEDVRLGRADTDMTPQMIADALAIKTANNKRALEWGGHWSSVKDSMHFEIDVGPADLADGIDPDTVAGWSEFMADAGDVEPPEPDASEPTVPADRYVVIARDGLNLRSGPAVDFAVVRHLPEGTEVNVLSRDAGWALVDLEGDGKADGFMHLGFLRPVKAGDGAGGLGLAAAARSGLLAAAAPAVALAAGDITDRVTPAIVKSMFPAGTRLANITANLPFVLAGLRARALGDRVMVLMALATIRAETEGFVPIDEGISKFNTAKTPFDLYDAGRRKEKSSATLSRAMVRVSRDAAAFSSPDATTIRASASRSASIWPAARPVPTTRLRPGTFWGSSSRTRRRRSAPPWQPTT